MTFILSIDQKLEIAKVGQKRPSVDRPELGAVNYVGTLGVNVLEGGVVPFRAKQSY